MKKEVVVANLNIPDSNGDVLLPGAIKAGTVPLTKEFSVRDHGYLGEVEVEEKDGKIVGLIDSDKFKGLYPAIGFIADTDKTEANEHGGSTFHSIRLCEISLCNSKNQDETIKPIE